MKNFAKILAFTFAVFLLSGCAIETGTPASPGFHLTRDSIIYNLPEPSTGTQITPPVNVDTRQPVSNTIIVQIPSSSPTVVASTTVRNQIPTTTNLTPPVKPIATTSYKWHLSGNLDNEGILFFTNAQRYANGKLKALTRNAQLDSAAEARLKDMFDQQYFEHVSPQGVQPSAVAKEHGYLYILFGENIALGDFDSNEALVEAWMNSPQHRENILNGKFTEIGLAVGKGIYKGKETWIAVQGFGFPASACTLPNEALKTRVDSLNTQITSLLSQASTLLAEIQAENPQTEAEVLAHNKKIDQYNSYVAQANALSDEAKSAASTYNSQVTAYNECAN